jgi:hypothetical protein
MKLAKKVIEVVELTDDLDGGRADTTVAFTWGGTPLEIDLSKRNAAAFHKVLKPYVDVARKVKATGNGRARSTRRAVVATAARRRDLEAVRQWANANGYSVSDRGRIASSVLTAYDSANA